MLSVEYDNDKIKFTLPAYVNDNRLLTQADLYENYGVLADLSEDNTGSANRTALVNAIDTAVSLNSYVRIPAGTFKLLGAPITIDQHLTFVGVEDAYAASMHRYSVKEGTKDVYYPYKSGSVIKWVGDGSYSSGSMFLGDSSGEEKTVSFSNIMFFNEKSDGTMQKSCKLVTPLTQGKIKVYMTNCCVCGFDTVFGSNSYAMTVMCSRTRFMHCNKAFMNLQDSRVTDCSINLCTYGFYFSSSNSISSGASTISNNRIEWCSYGVYLNSQQTTKDEHDIIITGNEFDRFVYEAINMTGGRRIIINNNVFRRANCNTDGTGTTAGGHISLNGTLYVVMVGNNTARMNSFDDGTGVNCPAVSKVFTGIDTTNIGLNDWSGAVTPN